MTGCAKVAGKRPAHKNPCAVVRCPAGKKCVAKGNEAKCVPIRFCENPCQRKTHCECTVKNHKPVYTKLQNCKKPRHCPDHLVCFDNYCQNICYLMDCHPDYPFCIIKNNKANCVKEKPYESTNPCKSVLCLKNTYCKAKGDRAHCISFAECKSDKDCPKNQACPKAKK